jgi:hypothetical protein
MTIGYGKFSRQLSMKHKITAINTLDVPVLVYSFGIVNWLRKEIEKIDQNLIKQLTTENLPSNRLYITLHSTS